MRPPGSIAGSGSTPSRPANPRIESPRARAFVPPPVHAGGLRYHGDASAVCALVKEGVVEAQATTQTDAFGAAVRFGRTEGILPAPARAPAAGARAGLTGLLSRSP